MQTCVLPASFIIWSPFWRAGVLSSSWVAGDRVVATDASPAMLDLAREHAPEAEVRVLSLPDDPLPSVDAVVSTGHVLNYLAGEADVEKALVACARALNPGGVLALDICDLEWGTARLDAPPSARLGDDWAIITLFSVPSANRFVRRITTFLRNQDGSWRRDEETHDNVLLDTSRLPELLEVHGLDAQVLPAFGAEQLPVGLRVLLGWKKG